MAKPKVTQHGDIVTVAVPLVIHSRKKTDRMFTEAIAEWTSKGYDLVHNRRVGAAGGTLTFQRKPQG